MTDPVDVSKPRFLIPILSASNFVIGMGAFMVVGLLNPLADDLAISAASAGWVMTSYALAYAILSPLMVAVSGDMGRRRVLAAGLTIFAIGCALSAMASGPVMLFAGRMVASAGAGLFTPVAAAVAAGFSAPQDRGKTLAAVFFGLTLSQVFGVPAGGWMAYTFGWRSAFWLVAGLTVPFIALIWVQVPRGLRFEHVSLRDLARVLGDGRAMLAVTFTTSFIAAIYILYTFIAPLLSETMGWGRDDITLVLVIYGCGAVIGNILGGAVADRIGAGRTLLILSISQVVIMPVFSFLPMPVAWIVLVMLVWPLFGWAFMAAQQARLLTLAPQAASVVLALNAAALYIGAALGSALGGIVLSGYGLHALGIGAGVAAIIAVGHITLSRRISG